jgi:hypothetical protein
MVALLEATDLPVGFGYPHEFLRVVELGLIDLEPWLVLEGEQLRARNLGLRERYPDRSLVPFARRQDNDDVACWDVDEGGGRVVIVHDFASPGWERRVEFVDFNGWLRRAVEDLIAFA